MSQKIISLQEEEIRAIGDAFADYKYAEAEWGMSYLCKGRQAVSDYICGYVRMAVKDHSMYSTSDKHEAFIAYKRSGDKSGFSAAFELLTAIPGNIDMSHVITMAKSSKKAGRSYKQILDKLKIPYIYVGLVAVTKEYQGQGYMRRILETAFEDGGNQALPVVLETDAVLKKAKYEHLGMKCVKTQHFADGVELYSMVYEPDNIPKEWKSETVLR